MRVHLPSVHEVLERLRAGNRARVARGAPRRSVAPEGDRHVAVVVACSDQPELPEEVFDVGVGELLVAQVPGPFVDESVAATISFGIGVLGLRLVLVLAHERCALLAGATGAAALPTTVVERLALRAVRRECEAGTPVPHRLAVEQAVRVRRFLGPSDDALVVPAVLLASGAVEMI